MRERYPGDKSVHPLDQLKREEKQARRSPHLNKRHLPGPDTIDRLDNVNGKYHHEGPYDAALLARNTSWDSSPLAALKDSNAEAIKATPEETLRDALERHRPIDNVAIIPPGMTDRFGRTYDYEEGDDMMIYNGGNFRRWPGIVSDFFSSERLPYSSSPLTLHRNIIPMTSRAKASLPTLSTRP